MVTVKMVIEVMIVFMVTVMVGDGNSDNGIDDGDVDGSELAMVMWNGIDDDDIGAHGDRDDGVGSSGMMMCWQWHW